LSPMILLKIYLAGLVVLITAIGLNLLANALGLSTWYDFLTLASQQGFFHTLKNLKPVDFLFLILLYPGLLGLSAYLTFRLTSLVLH